MNDSTIASTDTSSATSGVVVVGVDDSEHGREALRVAASVARQRSWKLRIVNAWHFMYPIAPFAIPPFDIEEATRDASKEFMQGVIKEVLGDDPDVDIDQISAQGPPGAVLVDASKDADLLVVGSRGRGGFASLTLGSASSACVHHAHCPVLVLRSK